LGQVETLVAMRMLLPHDREAVKEWVKEQADVGQASEILASLPQLTTGEAWVWAPALQLLERRRFPLARTFDSGQAPVAGQAGPALAPLDLKAVTARLESVAADVLANDPKNLKAEIARLKSEAAKAPKPDPAAVEQAEERGRAAGYQDGFDDGLVEGEKRGKSIGQAVMLARCQNALNAVRVDPDDASAPSPAKNSPQEPARPAPPLPQRPTPPSRPAPRLRTVATPSGGDASLTGPQRHLLGALAWWAAMGHAEPTRTQVAAFAGWTPKGSNLRNRLSELVTAGLVEYPRQGHVRLTPAGHAAAPAPDLGQTLLDSIRSILTGPQAALFEALLQRGDVMTRAELAEAVGWEAAGSNLRNRLSELSTLELVEYPARGSVQLKSWVVG
jgi:hypothetical protein